jgi:hypothetical protein
MGGMLMTIEKNELVLITPGFADLIDSELNRLENMIEDSSLTSEHKDMILDALSILEGTIYDPDHIELVETTFDFASASSISLTMEEGYHND